VSEGCLQSHSQELKGRGDGGLKAGVSKKPGMGRGRWSAVVWIDGAIWNVASVVLMGVGLRRSRR
jgi:hypothetical protein